MKLKCKDHGLRVQVVEFEGAAFTLHRTVHQDSCNSQRLVQGGLEFAPWELAIRSRPLRGSWPHA